MTSAVVPEISASRSIKQIALRGSAWTLGSYGLGQVLRLGTNLVLTRLLFPEAFGIMALVMTILAGLQMFSDVGLRTILIQSPRGGDADFLNTAWTLQVARGIILWLCACAAAWPAALLYQETWLLQLLPITGLVLVLDGCTSTKPITANRRLEIGRLTVVELVGTIGMVAAMCVLALVLRSIWALVFGNLAGALFRMALSHFALHGEENTWRWDQAAARELFHAGRLLFLGTAAWFLASQAERLLLGKFLSLAELGMFGLAVSLAAVAIDAPRALASRIVFPVLAESVRRRDPRVGAKYRRFRTGLLLAAMPVVLAMLVWSQQIVNVCFDARYKAAGWMLSLLALRSGIELLQMMPVEWLRAEGKFGYSIGYSVVRTVCMVILGAGGFALWGAMGAVSGLVLASLPPHCVLLVGMFRGARSLGWTELRGFAVVAVISGAWLAYPWFRH